MRVSFTKMHGNGNDFVVFDAIRQTLSLTAEQIRHISHRHFGVGCDQILVVENTENPQADFHYRIFNADGSEAEQCGNGARCIMRFIQQQQLSAKPQIVVATLNRLIELHQIDNGWFNVNMGEPVFEPKQIPFVADARALEYPLSIGQQTVSLGAVSMGNPHAVLQVDNTQTAAVEQLGPLIESHPRFPQQVNVGFMQIVSPQQIQLRVYERGAGETLACGSGACAAVAVGRAQGLLDDTVSVTLPGGELSVSWAGAGQPVWLAGPALTVYEGSIEL